MTDCLQNTREKSLGDDSNVSEAELHASNDAILEGWVNLQNVKAKIAEAKVQAIKDINESFAAELKSATEEYALLVSLTR